MSPTEARGACYFLAVTEHGVDHWGRYRDRYVPEGDRWLFAHRLVRTDGTTPGGWAASRADATGVVAPAPAPGCPPWPARRRA